MSFYYNMLISQGISPEMASRPPKTPDEMKLIASTGKDLQRYYNSGGTMMMRQRIADVQAAAKIQSTIINAKEKLATGQIRSKTDLVEALLDQQTALRKLDNELSVKTDQRNSTLRQSVTDAVNKRRVATGQQTPREDMRVAFDELFGGFASDPSYRDKHDLSMPNMVDSILADYSGGEVTSIDQIGNVEEWARENIGENAPNLETIVNGLKRVKQTREETRSTRRALHEDMNRLNEHIARVDAFDDEVGPQQVQGFAAKIADDFDQSMSGYTQGLSLVTGVAPQNYGFAIATMNDQIESFKMAENYYTNALRKLGAASSNQSNQMGRLMEDERFQAWARDNGFDNLGKGSRDRDGDIVGYVQGKDDARAIALWDYQNKHPNRGRQLLLRGGHIVNDFDSRQVKVNLPVDEDQIAAYRFPDGRYRAITESDGTRRYLTPKQFAEYQKDQVTSQGRVIRIGRPDGGAVFVNVADLSSPDSDGNVAVTSVRANEEPVEGKIPAAMAEKLLTSANVDPNHPEEHALILAGDNDGNGTRFVSNAKEAAALMKANEGKDAPLLVDSGANYAAFRERAQALVDEDDITVLTTVEAPNLTGSFYATVVPRHAKNATEQDPNQIRVIDGSGKERLVDVGSVQYLNKETPSYETRLRQRAAKAARMAAELDPATKAWGEGAEDADPLPDTQVGPPSDPGLEREIRRSGDTQETKDARKEAHNLKVSERLAQRRALVDTTEVRAARKQADSDRMAARDVRRSGGTLGSEEPKEPRGDAVVARRAAALERARVRVAALTGPELPAKVADVANTAPKAAPPAGRNSADSLAVQPSKTPTATKVEGAGTWVTAPKEVKTTAQTRFEEDRATRDSRRRSWTLTPKGRGMEDGASPPAGREKKAAASSFPRSISNELPLIGRRRMQPNPAGATDPTEDK